MDHAAEARPKPAEPAGPDALECFGVEALALAAEASAGRDGTPMVLTMVTVRAVSAGALLFIGAADAQRLLAQTSAPSGGGGPAAGPLAPTAPLSPLPAVGLAFSPPGAGGTAAVPEALAVEALLGVGTFGAVKLVRAGGAALEQRYALKELNKAKMVALQQASNVRAEVAAMRALGGHPLVSTLLGTAQDKRALYLLSEYAPAGDLDRGLERGGRLQSANHLRFYMAEIFSALAFAHGVGDAIAGIYPPLPPARRRTHTRFAVIDMKGWKGIRGH